MSEIKKGDKVRLLKNAPPFGKLGDILTVKLAYPQGTEGVNPYNLKVKGDSMLEFWVHSNEVEKEDQCGNHRYKIGDMVVLAVNLSGKFARRGDVCEITDVSSYGLAGNKHYHLALPNGQILWALESDILPKFEIGDMLLTLSDVPNTKIKKGTILEFVRYNRTSYPIVAESEGNIYFLSLEEVERVKVAPVCAEAVIESAKATKPNQKYLRREEVLGQTVWAETEEYTDHTLITQSHVCLDNTDTLYTYGGAYDDGDFQYDDFGIDFGDISVSGITQKRMEQLAAAMVNHLIANGSEFSLKMGNRFGDEDAFEVVK